MPSTDFTEDFHLLDLMQAEHDADAMAFHFNYGRPAADFLAVAQRLRAELSNYIGVEPTVVEELAELKRGFFAAHEVCDRAQHQATRWENPLPVPEWVERVRAALDGTANTTAAPMRSDADLNIAQFIDDLKSMGVEVTGWDRVAELDYDMTVPVHCYTVVTSTHTVQVQMPDRPLNRVRWFSSQGPHNGEFHQIAVNGSWWFWEHAVRSCRRDHQE